MAAINFTGSAEGALVQSFSASHIGPRADCPFHRPAFFRPDSSVAASSCGRAKDDRVSDTRFNSKQSPSRFCWLFKIDRERMTALTDHFSGASAGLQWILKLIDVRLFAFHSDSGILNIPPIFRVRSSQQLLTRILFSKCGINESRAMNI